MSASGDSHPVIKKIKAHFTWNNEQYQPTWEKFIQMAQEYDWCGKRQEDLLCLTKDVIVEILMDMPHCQIIAMWLMKCIDEWKKDISGDDSDGDNEKRRGVSRNRHKKKRTTTTTTTTRSRRNRNNNRRSDTSYEDSGEETDTRRTRNRRGGDRTGRGRGRATRRDNKNRKKKRGHDNDTDSEPDKKQKQKTRSKELKEQYDKYYEEYKEAKPNPIQCLFFSSVAVVDYYEEFGEEYQQYWRENNGEFHKDDNIMHCIQWCQKVSRYIFIIVFCVIYIYIFDMF